MPTRKLPLKNTLEGQEIIRVIGNGDSFAIDKLWRKYNFSTRDSFLNAGRKHYQVYVSQQPTGEANDNTELEALELQVLKIVQVGAVSVGEISRQIDRSSETVIKLIDSLRAKNYEVILDETRHEVKIPQEPTKSFKPTDFQYFRNTYRIGLAGDTHFCSIYQQVTLLHDAYKIFDDRKTDFNLHAGDLVDGKNMYRGQEEETFLHTGKTQADYVVANYPYSDRGTKTYIIGGQHDRSFFRDRGYNVIEAVCEERKDLIYRGFYNAHFRIKGLLIELQHPGGGVAYARSYRPQKIIENMAGYTLSIVRNNPQALRDLPIMIVFGHWHIPILLPCYMGIEAVSLPCFQSQTPYLQQKGLLPVIGCAVAEITLDKSGNLTSSKIDFINMNSKIRPKDY